MNNSNNNNNSLTSNQDNGGWGMQNGTNQYTSPQVPDRVPMGGLDQSFITGDSNVPETLTNAAFLPAYLIANIGNWARISLLVGDDLMEIIGEIWMVGASYVIVKTLEPNTTIMVDLFSIKLVAIIYDENVGKLVHR